MTSTERPQRGDIWLVALGASRSGEPGKTRPAVVISSSELFADSPRELVVVVPLSASLAPSPLRPVVSTRSGVSLKSRAAPRAIRGIARSRLTERIGRASGGEMAAISSAVALSLGLSEF